MRTTRKHIHYGVGILASVLAVVALTPATALASSGGQAQPLVAGLGVSLAAPNTADVPTNLTSPTISGTAQVGQTLLLSSSGEWVSDSPMTITQTWEDCDVTGSNCSLISGATSPSYTLQSSDLNFYIRVVVVAINADGPSPPVSSGLSSQVLPAPPASAPPGTSPSATPTPPVNTTAPTISGEPEVGTFLVANMGTWTGWYPITYTYQWADCSKAAVCTPIAGANAQTYNVQSSDTHFYIEVTVTASNAAGAVAIAAPIVGPVVPPLFYIPRPPKGMPPAPTTFGATPTCYPRDPKNAGLFVYLYQKNGKKATASAAAMVASPASSPVATAAGTSEAGWPIHQCLKMDKGPAGVHHTILGVPNLHNWLLGGYGNNTIIGGKVGDVIWSDYQPTGEPGYQAAVIHAGNGRNVIYANDTYNRVWTGTNPKTVVHAHENAGVIHCQNPNILIYTSHGALPHWKLIGCHRISYYSVGY